MSPASTDQERQFSSCELYEESVLKPNAVNYDDSEPDETTGNTANTDNDKDEQRKDNNYIDIT